MSRDSNGVYTLYPGVNPVVGGTTISSGWANPTMNDIATALTDSLDRNGQGTMNAPLPFADGLVSAPGITWGQEPSSGFYRAGAADMRVSLLGSDVFRWTTTLPQAWVDDAWVNIVVEGGPGGMPDGTIQYQSISWDNANTKWVPSDALLINFATDLVSTKDDLSVGADIIVAGLVDGRDIAADATEQTNHIADTDIHWADVTVDGLQYVRSDKTWIELQAIGEVIPSGTVDDQTLVWDTTGGEWLATSNFLITEGGDVSVAGSINVNSGPLVAGAERFAVVANHPGGGADANTIYFVTG